MEKNKSLLIGIVIFVVLVGGFLLMSNTTNEDQSGQEVDRVSQTDIEEMENEATNEPMVEEEKTIVEIAVESGDFETLVAAVKAADLVETLSGEGPFTVFAPTDEAFAKIPEATLNAILADKEQLTGILTYHVVAGKVMAADVVNLDKATTVKGQDLMIKVEEDGTVMVNDAKVLITDIEASNGVIHVIDTVVLPK